MSVFGYENLAETATITVTNEATGFPKANLVDWRLDDWWKSTSSTFLDIVNIDFDLGSSQAVDYVALAGHNFGTAIIGVTTQHDDNSGYTSVTTALSAFTPTDDSVVFKTFTSASDRYWRLRLAVGNSDTVAPILAHVSIGARYSPPVGMQAGHVMPKYGMRHKYVNSLSDNGLFVGRSLIRSEYETTIDLNLLSAAQMRSDIDPLIAHVIAKPFFFLWDETNYPLEAAYCWLRDDPSVSTNSSVHYSVSLPIAAVI